ncbi:DUF924 family protein [Pseudidiomarina sp.]|uniref:DUF924 family protein n=1 Tax=Pseudidiomarina sp. TaxID=2081707 RepID=UPI00299F1CA1|nr:DUF924 family protein [Pseudidiomarina sp.]MDX1706059.1 DUF924 family protein [Pseudidiomarina sp.]
MPAPAEVLQFWFHELQPDQWWAKDDKLDQQIAKRFAPCLDQAAAGELAHWRDEAEGRLAEIIVLDQFSRNIYRGKPEAFMQDRVALVLAQEAIRVGAHVLLSPVQRSFLYLPFMHSESRLIQQQAAELYRDNGIDENYRFALKHQAIIERFGRYPHRNETLGRESTPAERQFLKQPDSGF